MRLSFCVILTATLMALGCGNAKEPAAPAKPAAKPAAKAAAKPAAKAAAKPAAKAAAKPAAKPAAPKPAAAPGAPEQYAGAHILVAYKGSKRAKPTITRTKEEALARAKELAKKAAAPGADFAKLAGENSDGPSAARGGSLGMWQKGRMVPAFDAAIGKLAIGAISEPVETDFGYHVMKREPLPEVRSGAHILIAYKGAMRAKPTITRTKEEAQKKAKELAAKAKAKPESFAELAKANSDGPSGPRGGNLGTWPKGRMVPEFDKAIDGMKVGDVSDPVETGFGFHVIIRKAVKK